MNIAFATDSNYVQHLAVCIKSLLSNNKDASLNLFVLLVDEGRDYTRQLKTIVSSFSDASIEFLPIRPSDLERFRASGHVTSTAFARLYLADLLPHSLNRVLYLDCDLVIRSSIKDRYETDLNGAVLGAVEDLAMPHSDIGFIQSEKYFNSGVMIVDLKRWREVETTHALLMVAASRPAFKLWDQDILNLHFKEKFRSLSLRWNFQAIMAERPNWLNLAPIEFYKLRRDACIIHFTGNEKPWNYRDEVHFRSLYYKYLRLTPYRNFVPPDKTLRNMIIKIRKGAVVRRKVKWLLAPVIQLTKEAALYKIPVSGIFAGR